MPWRPSSIRARGAARRADDDRPRPGDRHLAVLDWRSSIQDGGVYPPIVAAGPPITSVGGHYANMGGEASCAGQMRSASAPGAASTSTS
jgi:hypothetical protein